MRMYKCALNVNVNINVIVLKSDTIFLSNTRPLYGENKRVMNIADFSY